ncbi:MAG TPA: class I SAM-dependent methyltransferase [Pyrinomonadaceae bacterium]|jgi:SAM-dependent methyltransferase|nr:class I SAM-dependent methyltransferase [Pyrinomonadaceae bacterium]
MTTYIGSELHLFAKAANWKAYYGAKVKKYLAGDVLEVGSGIGATTQALCDGSARRWVCLEPDAGLSAETAAAVAAGRLPRCCEARAGAVRDLGAGELFDAVIYIDVLEHIEDDAGELAAAAEHLKTGGRLVVLSPAHQWLYTPFDKEIGHHRRYNKKSLLAAAPPGLRRVELRYLDSVGMLASLGNRLLLRSSMPTEQQIMLWDRLMVPASRVVDASLNFTLGKSILGVWEK